MVWHGAATMISFYFWWALQKPFNLVPQWEQFSKPVKVAPYSFFSSQWVRLLIWGIIPIGLFLFFQDVLTFLIGSDDLREVMRFLTVKWY